MNWIDLLRDLLCRIYQEWGGDCANLGGGPSAWIDTVEKEYAKNGAPQGDAAGTLATLAKLLDCLDSPDNSLSASDNARLRSLIEQIQQDLGANP